jgi:FixJ family two-component response regulator
MVANSSSLPPVPAKDTPTVFVVDDDPSVRDSLRWLLESVALRVEAHASAREFLDTCDAERPGCLVLDVRLPGMSGLDLLAQLQGHAITLPVIIVTAFGDVQSAVRAMRHGAIDVMEKPVSDQLLLDRVHQAIELDREEAQQGDRRRARRGAQDGGRLPRHADAEAGRHVRARAGASRAAGRVRRTSFRRD